MPCCHRGDDEAEKAILKKFYRALSKMYHPDSNPGRATSGEMMALNRISGGYSPLKGFPGCNVVQHSVNRGGMVMAPPPASVSEACGGR